LFASFERGSLALKTTLGIAVAWLRNDTKNIQNIYIFNCDQFGINRPCERFFNV